MNKIRNLVIFLLVSLTSISFSQNCGEPYSSWRQRLQPNTEYTWWFDDTDNLGNFTLTLQDGTVLNRANSALVPTIENIITWAFNKWHLVLIDRNITFRKANPSENKDIRIYVEEGSGGGGSDNNLLECYLYESQKYTTVNAWANPPNSDNFRDIYQILLHEIGHVILGWGHTDYKYEDTSLMGASTNIREFSACDKERFLKVYNPIQKIIVKNSYGSGPMIVDEASTPLTLPISGKLFDNWKESSYPHSFTAIDDQKPIGINFYQKFQNWSRPGGTGSDLFTPVPLPTTLNREYKANFLSEFNITFKNNNNGSDIGGEILVEGVKKNTPTSGTHAYGEYPIKGKAINQTIKDIWYTFVNWNTQGGTNYEYNFTQTNHATYIANYEGTPTNGYRNQRFNTKINGQPIKVYWDQHPNTNVTKYGVYRKTKYGSEQLVKTVNRTGDSTHIYSFIDPEYVHTSSSNSTNLLNYDVRAYFAPDGNYSAPDFKTLYGEIDGPKRDDNPMDERIVDIEYEYGISNYPNPYNPKTTIYYSIKEQGNVQITVYDALGRKVADLVNEIKQPGNYEAMFNGSNLTSGIYFYTMKVNDFMEAKKMLLTK